MAYDATNWQDNVTPVDAEHLNNIEGGISALDNDKADQSDVDELKESKADQSDLDSLSTKVDEEQQTRADADDELSKSVEEEASAREEADDELSEKIQSNTDLIDSLSQSLSDQIGAFGLSRTRAIGSGGTYDIDYSSHAACMIYVIRGQNNRCGLYLCDQWSYFLPVIETSTVSISIENQVATVTNNASSNTIIGALLL